MVLKLSGQGLSDVIFSLSEQPKYWLENKELHILAASESVHYSLSSVDEISFVDERTSVEGLTSSALVSLYPNPAVDYIRVSNLPQNARLELLDASGRRVDCPGSGDASLLPVGHLPKGVYFLKISDETYKFIKE